MSKPRHRMVPSEQAGYGPGKHVVQYYDREKKVWFDVGDPKSKTEAQALLKERNARACKVSGNHSDDIVELWHGRDTPAIGCGFHVQNFPADVIATHQSE